MSMLKRLKKRLPHEKEEHIKIKRTKDGKAQLIKTYSDYKEPAVKKKTFNQAVKKKTFNQAVKEFKKQEAIKKKAESARKKAEVRKAIKYVQQTARKSQTGTGDLLTLNMLGGGSTPSSKKSKGKTKYIFRGGKAYPVAGSHKKKKKKKEASISDMGKLPNWGDLLK